MDFPRRSSSVATFWAILFAACLAAAQPATGQNDFLITGRSVGRITLGQTPEAAMRAYRGYEIKHVDLMLEGMPAPALQIYEGKNLLLTAEVSSYSGKIFRISTRAREFKTKEGIGVGSTFGAAKQQYGAPRYLGHGEGDYRAVFEFESGRLVVALDLGDVLRDHAKESDKIIAVIVAQVPK
jgi:hypothetical protein